MSGFRIEDTEEQGDEAGQLFFGQQPVRTPQHLMGSHRLMGEGVDHVLDQGGRSRRLDAVTGHVTDENGDTSILHFEHVVKSPPTRAASVAERYM